jgi:hypothetical protein
MCAPFEQIGDLDEIMYCDNGMNDDQIIKNGFLSLCSH